MKVVHVVRSVTHTSMIWNDLYRSYISHYPADSGFVVAVERLWGVRIKRFWRGRRLCRYLSVSFIAAVFTLGRLRVRKDVDASETIVHIHSPILSSLGIAAKLLGFKTVFSFHNSIVNYGPLQKLSLALSLGAFDMVLAVSKTCACEVAQHFKAASHCVVAIPNAIDRTLLRSADSCTQDNSLGPDVIIVARLVPQKNCMRILEVLERTKRVESVHWYGRGSLYGDLIKRVESSSRLNEIISFKGVVDRKRLLEAMSTAKCYLSMSRWEGIGVSNIEALSLPIEVILSGIDVHRELVGECSDEAILDLERSNQEWAEKVDKSVSYGVGSRVDELHVRAMKFRDQYSIERMTSSYNKVYREVIDESDT